MEKARKAYRAALLWMKDVSEKLHNPDLKDQLSKFRKVVVDNCLTLASGIISHKHFVMVTFIVLMLVNFCACLMH